MIKKIYLMCVAAMVMLLTGCEEETRNASGYMEGEGEGRTTVFHLASDVIEGTGTVKEVVFTVINPATHSTHVFKGTVTHDSGIRVLGRDGAAVCRVNLGEEDIPDGMYIVNVSGELVPDIGNRKVRFRSNIGTEEPRTVYPDLKGNGTEQDPYLIGDDADFQSFIYTLLDDETRAYGIWFRQTGSFDVPRRSMIIDGNIWAPTSFSGIYDGGGFELRSLTYQGASDGGKDVNIGLFSRLFDATVKNLTLPDALILNAHSNVGMLAGKSEGNCTIENITISGTVTACGQNIGGLVGENDGTITLRRITLNSLVVSGSESSANNVGALIGSSHNGDLSIEQVFTPDHIFGITGFRHVGGLAGDVTDTKEISVKNVTLEHSVDSESAGTKIVYASDIGVGALFGWIDRCTTLDFEKVSVKAPVRGRSDAGLLAGHAGGLTSVTVNSVLLTSVVSGEVSTGGFFGYLGLSNGGALNFNGSDGGTRYVLKSSADAEVTGGTHTGGLIGYFEANHGKVNLNASVEIAVNVRGTENVGGAIGMAYNLSGMNAVNLNFSSKTMRVTASGNNCGGLIGKGSKVTVNGGNTIKPLDRIPKKEDLKGGFNGVVTAKNHAGGIFGTVNGSVSGFASGANVTVTDAGDAGGIAGYLEGDVSSCAFTGDLSCPESAGGIVGATVNNIHLYDCVNLADLRGGENLGGILGYLRSDGNKDMKIERCYNSGHLRDGKNCGGIIAYPTGHGNGNYSYYHLVITECGNGGDIDATGDARHGAGGIVGLNGYFITEISRCTNHGNIHASTVMYSIGGVVGVMGYDGVEGGYYVRQCRNTGKVTCDVASTKLGGVVGHLQPPMGSGPWMESWIEDCRNEGEIPGDQKDDTGGILGFASHYTHIDRCYNNGKVSYGNAIVGTHSGGSKFYHADNYYYVGSGNDWPGSIMVNAQNVSKADTYHNFDFKNVWEITTSGPVLRNVRF